MKLKLVIISERTRYHFQQPLEYFKDIEIIHLYKNNYSDMDPSKFPNMIQYHNIFELYQKLLELEPDIIQGMEPYYGYSRYKIPIKVLPILLTTYLYCQSTKTPYFFHILENILPEKKYNWAAWIMKSLAKIYAHGAKFIFYLNQGAKKNLLHLGIDENKMFAKLWGIWGVDINKFQPNNLNSQLSTLNSILFVGRLIEQKGLLELIEAFSKVNKKFPDTKLVIVGKGPLKEKLQVTSYKLQVNIDFVGQVTSDQTIKYFQDAYITVSPTRSLSYSAEQIGVTNIESMACGTPVVATDSGSISEYVIDGKTGLLVPQNDPKAIEDAIIKLIKDEKLRDQMVKNCREYVLEKFDAKKNVLKLERFLLEQLGIKPH